MRLDGSIGMPSLLFCPTPAMWLSPGHAFACGLILHRSNLLLVESCMFPKMWRFVAWLITHCFVADQLALFQKELSELSGNPTNVCVLIFSRSCKYPCLQEHLAPLGGISKQAQGMVSNASSLATFLLQGVLDDFRYIMLASMSTTSQFLYTMHHIRVHTYLLLDCKPPSKQ